MHVAIDGTVTLPFTQTKQALDRLRKVCFGRDVLAPEDQIRLDSGGAATTAAQRELLAKAVGSVVGRSEERAVASLFSPGGTAAPKGSFPGIDDFEVVARLTVLSPATGA